MTKFITTTALALIVAAPAFAQGTDTDPADLQLNDENRSRMNVEDLTMVGDTRRFRIFEAPDGRLFRMPRSMFMDQDTDGLILNDDNLDRLNTDDLTERN